MSSLAKPKVLHLSGDFPDPFDGAKTRVIKRLIDLTRNQFDHRVISLNRVTPRVAELLPLSIGAGSIVRNAQEFDYGLAVQYAAPAKGIAHKMMLDRLADWIVQEHCRGWAPDLIIGHKLSIEGLAAHRAAKALGIPFAVSIQGNSDRKIVSARPDLKRHFSAVWQDAATAFPFTPWALDFFQSCLGERKGETRLLSCATALDAALPSSEKGDGLVSVFHLAGARSKNLSGLADAMRECAHNPAIPSLEIIGGGTAQQVQECERLIARAPLVQLAGELSGAQLKEKLNRSTGFVLPSLAESFGLVFIEALFAGIPVIYPKGNAIDGYFDGCTFAIAIDPRNPHEIASAIAHLCEEEMALKQAVANWQQSDHAKQFTRAAITQQFASGLSSALGKH
jgi:glycosyltransferase involved in cell wall biosynthesis